MSDTKVYEAHGFRNASEGGDMFTAEIITDRTEAEAIQIATSYCKLWCKKVVLYEVPYLNTSSVGWQQDKLNHILTLRP